MKSIKKIFLLFLPLIIGISIAYYFITTRNSKELPKNLVSNVENKTKPDSIVVNYDSLYLILLSDTNSKSRKFIDSLILKSTSISQTKKTSKKDELERTK